MYIIKCLLKMALFKRYQVVYETGRGKNSRSFMICRFAKIDMFSLTNYVEKIEGQSNFCIINIIRDSWIKWPVRDTEED